MVKDIAAGFAPAIVDQQAGETIYDLCAAPGTKSIVMSGMMNAEGTIVAVDINPSRLELLAENALNCRAENIKIRQDDVRELYIILVYGVILYSLCTTQGDIGL